MKSISFLVSFLFVMFSMACNHSPKQVEQTRPTQLNESEIQEQGLETAYFASGCFWCVEAVFQSVKGVQDAISGYAGGEIENPTYEQVSRGQTKHAESVKVIYDPTKVDFETLVKVFFGSQDPTTPNQQGPDKGTQYRSIAFYESPEEKQIIENYIKKLEQENVFSKPIVTEVEELDRFWKAEDYHQEYERNHPENPYVQSVSIPRLNRFKEKFPELLKSGY